MKKTMLLLLLLVDLLGAHAQNIKSYVQANRSTIRSIDPSDSNYTDLEEFGKAIACKRVIMLGEQDHGDAPAFLAKTRLIRYLHEKHGFNVLAFESDFFALTEGQQDIQNDTGNLRRYMQQNIFPIWMYCDAATYLFYKYLPQQFAGSTPMVVTGFDNQLHGNFSRTKLLAYLDSNLIAAQFPIVDFTATKTFILRHTDSLMINYGKPSASKAYVTKMDESLQRFLQSHLNQDSSDYLNVLLKSIQSFNRQSSYSTEYVSLNSARDSQMAVNLNWLVNTKYKDEKIIVWAANGHVMKNSQRIVGAGYFSSMGGIFSNMSHNKEQTYILGFTSNQGTAGRILYQKPFVVKKPEKASFENWFQKLPFAFIDFTRYNQQTNNAEAFKMKGISHQWNGAAKWTHGFDGIFYLKDMYHCIAIQ
jgi:erythromycin esterase